ncbi:uncharacterized protein OCT59_003315 [Rhizophagus irregularis]|uniref:uncharacterized protein n=1 Tax=Rhizophagus irregularis TaxID=588596 RepID=UPI0033282AD0|nr:hypothetical protein OCT59_003315 [Rhizophagus irregularis]
MYHCDPSNLATFSGIAFICEFISPELQAISTIWGSLTSTEIHYITLPDLSIKRSGEKKCLAYFFYLPKHELWRKEFLLTREPLDIVRISTALFVRVEEGEWTGNLKKEVENFENILQKVLERVLGGC